MHQKHKLQVHDFKKNNPTREKQNSWNKNKRKVIAPVEDGNMSNSQVSMLKLQLIGCERFHSRTTERAQIVLDQNYFAKQHDFPDQQTVKDAESPQTCNDVLVGGMHVSCGRNKQNRKRNVLSSIEHPNTYEMQWCHNSALGNHHQKLDTIRGKVLGKIQKKIIMWKDEQRNLDS